MAKQQPIHGEIDRSLEVYDKVEDAIVVSLETSIIKGEPIVKATNQAFVDAKFIPIMNEETLSNAVISMYGGKKLYDGYDSALKLSARRWYRNHHWTYDNLRLSDRVWKTKTDMKKIIITELRKQMKLSSTWIKASKSIADKSLVKGDVAGHMWDLVKLGRKNLQGAPAAAKLLEKALRKSQREIEKLAANGAPTTRLKKAYQNVVNQVRKGSKEGIEKAVSRAVKSKARYNVDRLVRSEYAQSYGQGKFARMLTDSDVVGYRSILSSRHAIVDICDFHSSADMYGMGAGVYPKKYGPPYQYHPHCSCIIAEVYKGKPALRKDYNSTAGNDYLNKQPDYKVKAMLGKRGADNYKKSGDWEHNLNNWRGQEKHNPEVPEYLFLKGD